MRQKIIFFSILPGLFSLLISFFDHNFHFKWIVFIFYLFSVLSGLVLIFGHLINLESIKKLNNSKFFTALIFIVVLSFSTRLVLLKNYPFVALGDQVRDGGLNAVQIINNEENNIFSYGRYSSHGLIIPEITSIFYHIFGNSNLTYRLPSAIVGIADVLLVFFLVTFAINLKSGFWSAFALAAMPLHLFYSRTQIVVIFSSLLTTLLLFGLYFYFNRKNIWSLISLGILIGVSFNFHASLKPVSLTILAIILLLEFFNKKITNILLTLFFTIIGFGPRIWFTPLTIFFHTSRVDTRISFDFFYRYLYSLGVWFLTPTQSFFKNNMPLIPPIFFIFVLVSIIFILFFKKKNFWSLVLVLFAFLIPLTNSAVTDGLNFDHRLAPLFPISAIFIGFGINLFSNFLRKSIWKYFFSIAISLLFLSQIFFFFYQRQADVNWDNPFTEIDYLSMHLIYLISSKSDNLPKKLCVQTSPSNLNYFYLAHVDEQYKFFLPNFSIKFTLSSELNNNILLVNDCQQKQKYQLYEYNCNRDFDFKCPKSYRGDLKIYF